MASPFGHWTGPTFRDLTFPPRSFLVDQWLRPEDAMLLVGREGIGKSTVLFQLLAHLTAGTPVFGLYQVSHPLRCLYVQLEGDKHETHHRLKSIESLVGFNWDNFEYAFLPGQHLETEEGLTEFCKVVHPYQLHVNVIATDPFYGLFAGSGNDDAVVKPLLSTLRRIKEECQAAFISGHHIRKSIFDPQTGKWLEEGAEDALGSRLIPAWFDTVFHIGGTGDHRTIRCFKGRKGGYVERVEFEAQEVGEVQEDTLSVWFKLASKQPDSCHVLLAQLLRQEDLYTIEQMAKLSGVTFRTMQRWLQMPEFRQTVVCVNSAVKPAFYAHRLSPAFRKFGIQTS